MNSQLHSYPVKSGNFMSTPASLHISHSGQTASFHQRCDGYPTFVLQTLVRWITTGGANKADGIEHNGLALNASHICGYSRELRKDVGDSLNLNCFARSQDRATEEWVQLAFRDGDWSYLIDLDTKVIKVFENVWEGHLTDFDTKTTDPRTYVKVLIPEAVEGELKIINDAMQALTDAGFTIN